MFVDDLKGPWLDYWVGRAEGDTDLKMSHGVAPARKYSSDPSLARPIIERERIYIGSICDAELGNLSIACIGGANGCYLPFSADHFSIGDSDLEAGMRCYLHSKFGPEVV